jgi:uncharacterized membrane protein YccF (DUF307 family)
VASEHEGNFWGRFLQTAGHLLAVFLKKFQTVSLPTEKKCLSLKQASFLGFRIAVFKSLLEKTGLSTCAPTLLERPYQYLTILSWVPPT